MAVPKLRFPEFSWKWQEKRLGGVCEFFSGGTPSVSKFKYYDENIPFIKSGELSSRTTQSKITYEGLKNSSAKLVDKGDLIYALYGSNSC
ncbi:MAG: restriction endonuclease subunit S [Oscillospiraceae bacterium]|nr:restriction endonuclease subunit S [Oscillospiraceae bacterium]